MNEVVLFFPKTKEKEESRLLPASILMVAAPLVKAGFKVKIIDQRAEPNWRRILIKELKNEPLVFGVSSLTGRQIEYALEASHLAKEKSEVPVVWGGVHASLLPEQTLKNASVDFVVIGEGEQTFSDLCLALKNKTDFKQISGLGFKDNRRTTINLRREFLNMDELPRMPYELVNLENYISEKSFASGQKARNIALYTSRGCPHRCGFCYNQRFNKGRWRGQSAERVVAEMEHLIKNWGINAFEIEDDEFFVDLERAKKICEMILQKNWDIEIFATCRINYLNRMNDDYLFLIKKAGFKTLAFGVESGSGKILKMINKDITREQVLECVRRLKKAGINSKYYFMAGFPGENEDDLKKTTELIWQIKQIDRCVRIPAWRTYTPYPGTDLYQVSREKGFNPPETLKEWANFDFGKTEMPWLSGRQKRIIKNGSFLSRYICLEKPTRFKWSWLYGRIADWRWRHFRMRWVPESFLINFLTRFKS